MTLKELLAIDVPEGDCPGCPVCEPRGTKATERRSVSVLVRSDPAAFSVRYTDARTDPTEEEEGVMGAVSSEV